MIDKEIIKEAIIAYKGSIEGFEECFDAGKAKIEAINHILKIIDSLPEEPTNVDLEEEITKCYKRRIDLMMTRSQFGELIHHFAEWQKEKDYKMYAHVPLKDIHDAWQELKKNKPDIEKYPAICFQKGTDWIENQMKEALQTEYEKGRFDMREEMMKDAVEAKVDLDLDGNIKLDCEYEFHVGDKVKIIIVKEEKK